MTDGAALDEWLRDLLHFDRRLYACRNTFLFQGILHCQGVDHRAQHAHVIGLDAVNAHLFHHLAADEIAAADHDGQIDPQMMHLFQLIGKPGEQHGIKRILRRRERLTAQL